RWCERLLEEGPNGPRGAQFYLARWLAPHIAQELERPERLAALKRTKVRDDRRPAPAPKLTDVDATPPLLALVDAPEKVTKSHTLEPMPVQTGAPVTVTQEAVQPAQDGPGATPLVELPCNQGTPMQLPGEADSETTLWTTNDPMDTRGEPPGTPELHDEIEARAPIAAVCSLPPPASLTAPTVEPVEPKPAAAAYVRPYVPPGGWSEATIAALPGVARGGFSPDDPWIALQRELAGKAAAVPA
ncbi:MAG: hypothetical protein M3380_21885, partial [Chloroflexota bacterium]|nr:hypothetical protein [Chloroflexota bacterium]